MQGLNSISLYRVCSAFEGFSGEAGPDGLMDKLRTGADLDWVELAALCNWMGMNAHLFMVRPNLTPKAYERLGRQVDLACNEEDMQRRLDARMVTGPIVVQWSDGSKSILDAGGSQDLFEY